MKSDYPPLVRCTSNLNSSGSHRDRELARPVCGQIFANGPFAMVAFWRSALVKGLLDQV